IGYFWLYPERGGKTIEIIKSYIPVSKTNQGARFSSIQGINLIQVRQKLVYNTQIGRSIRVIEGIAENSTPRPVSKINIVANLYDAEGAVLASTESFGGNVIIDEKLESLDAKEILEALKDVKTMEDRVQPKGQIPFMIVFVSEPAGVFRLSVLPVDFKKH
ncbi:MAG: putative rane protein, partial [Firmicutes bacterium]|nr:putative rane protein [Bacillota bacterium]